LSRPHHPGDGPSPPVAHITSSGNQDAAKGETF
jgi:hypothetical protein